MLDECYNTYLIIFALTKVQNIDSLYSVYTTIKRLNYISLVITAKWWFWRWQRTNSWESNVMHNDIRTTYGGILFAHDMKNEKIVAMSMQSILFVLQCMLSHKDKQASYIETTINWNMFIYFIIIVADTGWERTYAHSIYSWYVRSISKFITIHQPTSNHEVFLCSYIMQWEEVVCKHVAMMPWTLSTKDSKECWYQYMTVRVVCWQLHDVKIYE